MQLGRSAHFWPQAQSHIVEAPAPRIVMGLHTFLGLVNYYDKLVPNFTSFLHPLHQLLRAETHWIRTKECQHSFDNAKARLVTAPVLTNFDHKLPICMAGDALNTGFEQSSRTSCAMAQNDPSLTHHTLSRQMRKYCMHMRKKCCLSSSA